MLRRTAVSRGKRLVASVGRATRRAGVRTTSIAVSRVIRAMNRNASRGQLVPREARAGRSRAVDAMTMVRAATNAAAVGAGCTRGRVVARRAVVRGASASGR